MRLTIFNGSPRGAKSNSVFLINLFTRGYLEGGGIPPEIFNLNNIKRTADHVEAFRKAEGVLIFFPLYTDAMPGIVKHFIEALAPLRGREGNPGLGFVIQSGFPEPGHSGYVARYMEKLAVRLGSPHTGTAIRGGVEGIRVQPDWMTKKTRALVAELGRSFARTGVLDPDVVRRMAPRPRLSKVQILAYRVTGLFGIPNMYWNMMLRKNNAFDRRNARPFL